MSENLDSQRAPKTDVSRRKFLRDAAKVAAGVAVGAGAVRSPRAQASVYKSILPAHVLGANEMIRTGHIGVGGMGRADLNFVMQRDDMQPIAICDIWYENKERAADLVASMTDEPSEHHDYREVIDNKDVDAVVIATPDHWHTIPAIAAAQAGKDIYCEKPLCTTMLEALAHRDAVKNSKVVYQAGNMQRSCPMFQEAVQLIKDGYLGKIGRVECFIHDNETIEGMGDGNEPMPDRVDWETHQGWTEHVPWNKNRWLYNFRWFLEYSGGKITDWGAHLLDIALMAMGEDQAPNSIVAAGGKYIMTDNRTTPDTLEVLWEFDNYVLSFSNKVWNVWPETGGAGQIHGILFHGTHGTMKLDRNGYEVIPLGKNGAIEPRSAMGTGPQMNIRHWQNFADCIRSRETPISSIDVIYNTTMICHMGTSAYVAGAKLGWDPVTNRFTGGDAEAVKTANDFAYRPYLNGYELT
jgi:predicted dehydrogenase